MTSLRNQCSLVRLSWSLSAPKALAQHDSARSGFPGGYMKKIRTGIAQIEPILPAPVLGDLPDDTAATDPQLVSFGIRLPVRVVVQGFHIQATSPSGAVEYELELAP